MDAQIKQMVPEYIKPMPMIVKGQGKIEDKPTRQIIPNALQIAHMPYSRIIDYGRHIIKMKGTKEGVGIDNNAYTSNAYYRKRPDIKRLPLLIHEGILLSGQG